MAVARTVLPAAAADSATVAEAVEALQGGCAHAGGLNLLQLAVRSGNAALVAMLLDWATAAGCRWDCACRGPAGITALHLSALLQDDGEIAALLQGMPSAQVRLLRCVIKTPSSMLVFCGACSKCS